MTRAAFRSRIKQYLRDIADDHAYPFFIFATDHRTLLGAITLSNVRRGVAQSATLGYWIGAALARRGHMTDAVQTLLPFAFDHLGLHRVEAACIPATRPRSPCCTAPASTRKVWPAVILRSMANGAITCCSPGCRRSVRLTRQSRHSLQP